MSYRNSFADFNQIGKMGSYMQNFFHISSLDFIQKELNIDRFDHPWSIYFQIFQENIGISLLIAIQKRFVFFLYIRLIQHV